MNDLICLSTSDVSTGNQKPVHVIIKKPFNFSIKYLKKLKSTRMNVICFSSDYSNYP